MARATAMYDAIVYGCEKPSADAEPEPAARILIVLSDGNDNSSQGTLHQAIAVAQRREVTVYTVSVNGSGFLGPVGLVVTHFQCKTATQ